MSIDAMYSKTKSHEELELILINRCSSGRHPLSYGHSPLENNPLPIPLPGVHAEFGRQNTRSLMRLFFFSFHDLKKKERRKGYFQEHTLLYIH